VELLPLKLPRGDMKPITNDEIREIQREIFKLEKQIEELK
jgi:hypothetical protein